MDANVEDDQEDVVSLKDEVTEKAGENGRSRHMPRQDRTGPMGAGPRTGWGMGLCGTEAGRSLYPGGFRGLGRGGAPWGGGRGRCRGGFFGGWGGRFFGGWGGRSWWPFSSGAPLSTEQEAEALKAELTAAREDLAAMEARLKELEQQD